MFYSGRWSKGCFRVGFFKPFPVPPSFFSLGYARIEPFLSFGVFCGGPPHVAKRCFFMFLLGYFFFPFFGWTKKPFWAPPNDKTQSLFRFFWRERWLFRFLVVLLLMFFLIGEGGGYFWPGYTLDLGGSRSRFFRVGGVTGSFFGVGVLG